MRAKKYLKRLGLILLITCAVILVTLEVISRGAAQIFNHAMANQDMLRGTITVERLISDITGHVYFTNLVWTDREGNPISRSRAATSASTSGTSSRAISSRRQSASSRSISPSSPCASQTT